jgi:hypothetical protein
MSGVGEKRERDGQEAADSLCDHEPAGQDRREKHPPAVAAVDGRRAMMRVRTQGMRIVSTMLDSAHP